MKVKVLAMAACMGLSFSAFAQNEQERMDKTAAERAAEAGRLADAGDCDEIREHHARARCMDVQASRGQSSAVPVTQQSGASGPGAVDKTHPGLERGLQGAPNDVGTSSAGS